MPEKKGFRWGFQWWKVGSGLMMFLIGGGLCVGFWIAGYVHFWSVIVAGAGLLTMISGLIGDEAENV